MHKNCLELWIQSILLLWEIPSATASFLSVLMTTSWFEFRLCEKATSCLSSSLIDGQCDIYKSLAKTVKKLK